ncbi:hypothetical protein [Tabrizicola sp.]|uniref:hypothetical protein n=1 Tax=Tabrizicola sp. TaxID=2005166 RepID=UPI003F3DA3D2
MDGIDPRDLPLGHDEACAADLHAVADGRMLGRQDRSWLARAVAGAIRPSRDRPLWDLAHAIAALGVDGTGLIDLALDPSLASAAVLQDRLGDIAAADSRGLVLTAPRPWRCSWTGLARCLSLAEFILTADALDGFTEISERIGPGITVAEAPDLARALAARMAAYRRTHMPAAPIERSFHAIREYLRNAVKREGFVDDDILTFWQNGVAQDVMFTTVVEHFITYERVLAEMGTLSAIGRADSLEDMDNWEDRLEAASLPLVDAISLQDAMELLDAVEDGPKVLTGAEQEALAAVLNLDPFHRARPLTALRARVFGRIQAGIANRLRRGTGGADLADRIPALEADYSAAAEATETLVAHLRRCLTIALALRTGAEGGALAEQGMRELRRMRRAGFDMPHERLAEAMAHMDEALAATAQALEEHRQAIARLHRAEPLDSRVARDRAAFSQTFAAIYRDHIRQEMAR